LLYMSNIASAALINNIFTSNYAYTIGLVLSSGKCVLYSSGNTYNDNGAYLEASTIYVLGGAATSLIGDTFINNYCDKPGSGKYLIEFIVSSGNKIQGCYFRNNIAEDKSSGIFFDASEGTLENNFFTMTNIYQNAAVTKGRFLSIGSSSTIILANSTF
jgi:hypothetical protein